MGKYGQISLTVSIRKLPSGNNGWHGSRF